jgi:hypothetical protein
MFSTFQALNAELYYDRLVYKLIQLLTYKVIHSTDLNIQIVNETGYKDQFERFLWIKSLVQT